MAADISIGSDDSVPDHKLSGFLCAVLSLNSPENAESMDALAPGARCHFFWSGPAVGLRAENGVVLSPIGSTGEAECEAPEAHARNGGLRPKKKKMTMKKMRARGRWTVSVVHQLRALVSYRCIKIVSRIVRVSRAENGEGRAVVLVDVHLPFDLWSGWQFPRSASTAVALFRHLSCDWQLRSSILLNKERFASIFHDHNKSIWNLSSCHVLGCKLQCRAPGSLRKKLIDLHEIFKNVNGAMGKENPVLSRLERGDTSSSLGIWELSDDVLLNILTALGPRDLVRVAATCRHLRSLAMPVIPCAKLKLFPHQQKAVEWMLQRERNAEVLPHPLYMSFQTEDGFSFYINSVSGEIATGLAPTVRDFQGGLFCDEPGLGKTITALSLILKTQGTPAKPPNGAGIIWCPHDATRRCGFYELSSCKIAGAKVSSGKRGVAQTPQRGQLSIDNSTPPLMKRARILRFDGESSASLQSMPSACMVRCTRSLSHVKRNLFDCSQQIKGRKLRKYSAKPKNSSSASRPFLDKQVEVRNDSFGILEKAVDNHAVYSEQWVQCDGCHKWRKLGDTNIGGSSTAWFCSMNTDPLYQSCSAPEEFWDYNESITYYPGFHTKGSSGCLAQNVSFFTSVLREHYAWMNTETKQALMWLAKLSPRRLSEMESVGLARPMCETSVFSGDVQQSDSIFQAFGLIKGVEKGITRWYYPRTLQNLVLDLPALRIALSEPLDSFRMYLSSATLVVVPQNLVDHWVTQIEKFTRPGQLRVYVWNNDRKPSAHSLAWDYDVVITTFSRLSAEWGPRKRSVLMQVHWLRVMLDEGHTLGSSLSITNKLQMAISLTASNRWVLTGTPTPNTPNNQLSNLQPILKFLHMEAYGENPKSWEFCAPRPLEADMDEGRSRLLELLSRCMISARKIDLHAIPPCIKEVTYINFTEEHARSYNELVVTVRRNILLADWNDPSHVESLLNPKQWKFRGTTIRNVRLSCCVAGHIKVTEAGLDIQETMDVLVKHGLDPLSEEHALIKYNLLYGGDCMRCKEWCRLPIITPCRHLLCLDCVALDGEKCTFPGCGNLYEMQTPDILTRPENPNPKWAVPKDLIELQPSYKQDNWDPDWQSTSSSKVTYLVHKLKALQEANNSMDDRVVASSNECTANALVREADCYRCGANSNKILKDKVIIFSQFLEHIHVIEQQLGIADIRYVGMYSPMHSSKKMEALAVFQHDTSCMALLMDGSAALGLDLSFVTYVFMMEPIWDRSMEEQVISRAHRMGATRPVHVETLAMRGTIEEQMLNFLQDSEERRRCLKEEVLKPDHGGARLHHTLHDFAESSYLARLSFVRTSSHI